MAGEVQSTQKKFYGGDVAQGESSSTCKVKRLKKASVVVDATTDPKTRTVLCDPDISTVEPPYMEILSPFKLAEWIDAGYEIYLEDQNIALTSVYQMQLSKASFLSNGEGRYVSACDFDVIRKSGNNNVFTRWECSTESDVDTGSMYVWVENLTESIVSNTMSALICRGGERPSYRGETWELKLWQNPDWIEGDKLSVEWTGVPSAYFIYVPNGVCEVSGYYEFTWDDDVQLRNEIVNLEGTPFDLSYYHSQIVPFHFVKRYATSGGGTNKFGFEPNRTDWPTGIKYWVKKLSLVYLGEL